MSILTDFWKQIDGPVHPLDRPIFEELKPENIPFNIQFPPPAYWGAVDTAKVLVLYNNGGYKSGDTESEFANANMSQRYIRQLHDAIAVDPGDFSPYYKRNRLCSLVAAGDVAWVNAVAYRSPKASDPRIQELSKTLPSVRISRKWLQEEVLPEAINGGRLVVFHRWSLWGKGLRDSENTNVVFSKNPVSEQISDVMVENITNYLKTAKF